MAQNALRDASFSPAHLSPSKVFLLRQTGVHAASFTISDNKEYFIFMDLRRDEGWRSDRLSDAQLHAATSTYNARLLQALGGDAILKRPIAIKQKLESVEKTLVQKAKTNEWASKWYFRMLQRMLGYQHLSATASTGNRDYWPQQWDTVDLRDLVGDADASDEQKPARFKKPKQVIVVFSPRQLLWALTHFRL